MLKRTPAQKSIPLLVANMSYDTPDIFQNLHFTNLLVIASLDFIDILHHLETVCIIGILSENISLMLKTLIII